MGRATRLAGPRPPQPPRQPPQQSGGWTGQPWPGPDYRPDTGAPPASAASDTERIRVDELLPLRPVLPSRGWRLAVYKATFGLVNLGPSADEIRQAELENEDQVGVARPLQGRRHG